MMQDKRLNVTPNEFKFYFGRYVAGNLFVKHYSVSRAPVLRQVHKWIGYFTIYISVTWLTWETLPLTVSDAVEEGWTLQDKCQGEFFSIEIGQGIFWRFYSDKTIAILMYQVKNELCPPFMRKNTLDYDVRNSDFIIPRFTTVTHAALLYGLN